MGGSVRVISAYMTRRSATDEKVPGKSAHGLHHPVYAQSLT